MSSIISPEPGASGRGISEKAEQGNGLPVLHVVRNHRQPEWSSSRPVGVGSTYVGSHHENDSPSHVHHRTQAEVSLVLTVLQFLNQTAELDL